MQVLGLIPARYHSTRLPGKPLAPIAGYPMIQWVYTRVKRSLGNALVATDDKRIVQAVEHFGGKALLTPSTLPSGTNRCAWALQKLKEQNNPLAKAEVIVNVQGDEPFIEATPLQALVQAFIPSTKQTEDNSVQIATLATPFTSQKALEDASRVKVVLSKAQKALYFSRSIIPYMRNQAPVSSFFRHVGVYAFRSDCLLQLAHLSPTPLENIEGLEQLRWLEHGYSIHVVPLKEIKGVSVDTPDDLAYAHSEALRNHLTP